MVVMLSGRVMLVRLVLFLILPDSGDREPAKRAGNGDSAARTRVAGDGYFAVGNFVLKITHLSSSSIPDTAGSDSNYAKI
jgi:hypothetical protein